MTTHSCILAWEIPRTEEDGGMQSTGLQRVGQDGATHTHTHTHRSPRRHPHKGHTHLEEAEVPAQQSHFSLHVDRHQAGALHALHTRAGGCPPGRFLLRPQAQGGLWRPPAVTAPPPQAEPWGARASEKWRTPPSAPSLAGRITRWASIPSPEASFPGRVSPAPRAQGSRTGSQGWTGG